MRPKHAGVFHVPCRSIAHEHIFRTDADYVARSRTPDHGDDVAFSFVTPLPWLETR